MKAIDVYRYLENDFIRTGLSDDWARYMGEIEDFLTDSYKKRSMGLVCDNTREIEKVYAAVFPSEDVTGKLLESGETDVLLFVHHPSIWTWDPATAPFRQVEREVLTEFRERRIAIYNLHVPLDNYSRYSTTVSYAKALGIEIGLPFAMYYGALGGVFGTTDCTTVDELNGKLKAAIGHETGVYPYGGETIRDGRVAVIAGGGMLLPFLNDIKEASINTFVTGISVRNEFKAAEHRFAEENGITILGGTHYSTEKFACQAMCGYFKKLGLPAEFVEGTPDLEDM